MQQDGMGTFGEVLHTYRKQKRISQDRLALQLAVHRNTISAWERGEYLPKTRGMVLEIANQLGLGHQATLQLLEASLTAVSPYWYVPYQRNPFFTGRETILCHLHEALGPEHQMYTNRSYALTGLGGVGKTQTALEYAYRYAHDYTAVFWIDAETRESLLSSFHALANLLHLPERHSPDHSQLIAAVQRWLSSHRQWLVIFDNVEDMTLVSAMMPASWSGTLLLTTQRQSLGANMRTIHLDMLNAEESFQFLLRRSSILNTSAPSTTINSSLSPCDERATRDIVALMDGLPLALDQAGAYIEATQCSSKDFLSLLRSSQMRLLEERATEADHPISVLKTFALAFAKVQRQNPFAADLLTVCAFLAPDAIPEALLIEYSHLLGETFHKVASDPLQFNAAIRALLAYSLIQRHAQTHTLAIHRLVQMAILDQLTQHTQRTWMERILAVLNQAFPARSEQMACWPWCEQLVPHVTRVAQLCEAEAEPLAISSLLYKTASYFHHRTRYAEAELLHQHALRLREQELGRDHRESVESLIGLAEACRSQGKFSFAILYAQRAIDILERTLGSQHIALVRPLNGLAFSFRAQGRLAEAERIILRSLSIWATTIQHDSSGSEKISSIVSGSQEELLSAQTLIPRVLSLWEQEPQRHHYLVGYALTVLSQVYQQQQRYSETEAILLPLHHIGKLALGEKHHLIANPLLVLVEIYKGQGRLAEAEQCYQRILAILEPALGVTHPKTRETKIAYTQLLTEMARDGQRQALHEVEQCDKQHGRQHVGNNAELDGETSRGLPVCPHCHSNAAVIKSGSNRSNSPRFRCRVCQRYFTPQPRQQGYDPSLKQQALTLVAQGKSYRSIARTLNVDHRTIGIWVKEAQNSE